MKRKIDIRMRVHVLSGYLKHWLAATVATPPGAAFGYFCLMGLAVLLYHTNVPTPVVRQRPLLTDMMVIAVSSTVVYVQSRHTHARLREAMDRLGRQSDLITVLLRVLRHNLRNRITVIRGHLQEALTDEVTASEHVPRIQSAIDNLLKLSEQARQIESIITVDTDTRYVNITATVREIVNQVEREYPGADITVDQTEPITVGARPTLNDAVLELITNAVKHSSESPSVTVSISRSYRNGQRGLDGVELVVSDSGPGLPENERQVLHEGAEQPLVHGSGLGLYQVYLVVNRHGGNIDTTVSEEGTRIVVSLPNSRHHIKEAVQVATQSGHGHTQFRTAFEESPVAMAIVDDSAYMCAVNARLAAIVGIPRNQLVGRPLDEFLDPEDEITEWWETVTETASNPRTVPLVDSDGREITVTASVTREITADQHLVVVGATDSDRVDMPAKRI